MLDEFTRGHYQSNPLFLYVAFVRGSGLSMDSAVLGLTPSGSSGCGALCLTMSSAVLGLTPSGSGGTFIGFDEGFALEDTVQLHAFAPLETLPCV
jgi:hypothetical protein